MYILIKLKKKLAWLVSLSQTQGMVHIQCLYIIDGNQWQTLISNGPLIQYRTNLGFGTLDCYHQDAYLIDCSEPICVAITVAETMYTWIFLHTHTNTVYTTVDKDKVSPVIQFQSWWHVSIRVACRRHISLVSGRYNRSKGHLGKNRAKMIQASRALSEQSIEAWNRLRPWNKSTGAV